MNIVDVIIILFLGLGAVTGFVRGFFKQTVMFVGTILVVVLAFLLKNPLSMILYENLPFFKIGGLTALNILLYEALAFIICIAILTITLNIIIKISGIIETVLNFTIILALPSKLLGMLVGLIQSVVIVYVILFIASMPVFEVKDLSKSKYAKIILEKTPLISNVTNDVINTFDEIKEFSTKKIDISDVKNTNRNIVEIMLKNDVVTTDSVILLNEKGKIDIDNLDELINKYKKES